MSALIGCTNGEDAGSTETTTTVAPSSTPITTSAPVLDPAVQAFIARLTASPDAIADEVNKYGDARVTPADVDDQARALCEAGFSPFVTEAWLSLRVPHRNLLLLGPVHRLLDLASTPRICRRGPSPVEQQQFRSGIYSYLKATDPQPRAEIPDAVQRNVCGFLQHESGSQTVEALLESILAAMFRNRIDPDDFLPLAVEITAQSCEQWLPVLRQALDKYFNSNV
ncbi:hypothetical protein [Kribbella sp. CA-247076]|uniref:hypothetical protein n=1 Tax=Kribbella sp. CA-247076 TaxID=3239941 RepID=UPI003D8B542C